MEPEEEREAAIAKIDGDDRDARGHPGPRPLRPRARGERGRSIVAALAEAVVEECRDLGQPVEFAEFAAAASPRSSRCCSAARCAT